jgi:hypothetical protein
MAALAFAVRLELPSSVYSVLGGPTRGATQSMDEGRAPEAVVAEFIRAMHAWELRAWELARIARDSPAPESYWPEVCAIMDSVFAEHCTVRERPQGRQASFQRPPQYDSEREAITRVDVDGDRAYVETERTRSTIASVMSSAELRPDDALRRLCRESRVSPRVNPCC